MSRKHNEFPVLTKYSLLSLITIAILLFSGCTSMEKLSSYEQKGKIIIDGNEDDWVKGFCYFEEQQSFIGVTNDANNLYLFIKTSDKAQYRNIITAGLTLWFNNKGDKSETFGIRYPVGLSKDMKFNENEPDMMRPPDKDEFQDEAPPEERKEMLLPIPSELEIITDEGKSIKKVTLEDAALKYGIKAAIKRKGDVFAYELSIPMAQADNIFNLNLQDGSIMGIGIEGSESDLQREDKRGQKDVGGFDGPPESGPGMDGGGMPPPGDFPGGGMPPGGGMGKGGRGGSGRNSGRPGPGMSNSTEPLDLWLEVQLAKIGK